MISSFHSDWIILFVNVNKNKPEVLWTHVNVFFNIFHSLYTSKLSGVSNILFDFNDTQFNS